jgi:hypothetical protein
MAMHMKQHLLLHSISPFYRCFPLRMLYVLYISCLSLFASISDKRRGRRRSGGGQWWCKSGLRVWLWV